MKLRPRSLWLRLILAFALSMVCVTLLAVFAEWFDPPPTSARRPMLEAKLGEEAPTAPARVIDLQVRPEQRPGAAGLRVPSVGGTIAIARRLESLPPDVAPVVEVFGDGVVALRRAVPVAQRPDARPPRSRDGHGAGIVLGGMTLADLGPDARRALIQILSQVVSERPIEPRRLRPVDFPVRAGELQRLLRWIP